MSLKSFHIFFIVVSILLAFGFGAWSLYAYATDPDVLYWVLGLGSLVVGVGLIVYGVKVVRKLRRI